MSSSSDNRPLAPPRSLGKQPQATETQQQAQTRPQQAPPPRPAPPATDAPTERNMPVSSSPGPQPPVGATAMGGGGQTVDRRTEKARAKAQRKAEARGPRRIRRAKLRVVRVDPWSVTKAAFLLSIAFGIMCVVAVFLVFSIISASGLWDSINSTIQAVVDQKPSEAFDIKQYVAMDRVMGITMLISAIDVVILTALATLGAFIYNMSASLLGGVEVTLAEDLS